jgi:hypothetical protein
MFPWHSQNKIYYLFPLLRMCTITDYHSILEVMVITLKDEG